MRHSLAAAILLASTVVAAPAFAAGATSSEAQSVDTSTTASTGAKADLGTVLPAIQASRTTATAIQALTTVGTVNVVKLSPTGNDKEALEKAVSENQADITGLQAAIMANSALKTKLDSETIDTSAVVAASIEADGSVTVFVR
ncbi:hypothetical protein ACFFTN_07785 [Aminobacter aganoensis]|uniref:Secreted protein n=1 Tax=Aminobacter aganoensis TaxID=83264 RepID=A0A7X0F9I1_9HYPH|nr:MULTISPECIES: hypothetical protein [Aminobacter]KQU73139.1 hypothetical protein ASC75_05665 [Aminobacter sp. DSM 101952]MBB6355596.1 hypothetical protein [Aminobacter aganoensis]